MGIKYIFSADDYGPIHFINDGVCSAVQKGFINSVQVLANIEEERLLAALQKLEEAVPNGSCIDIGLHLTLTSGAPLYGFQGAKTKCTWGKSVDKNGNFKKYTHFNFKYDIPLIRKEFAAQKQLLVNCLNKLKSDKLKFTSVSHHHNMLVISPDLVKEYIAVAGDTLAVRAPKMYPNSRKWYYRILPLFNFSDSRAQRKHMRKMYAAFLNNRFLGSPGLCIKSPSYVDTEFYRSLGSLFWIKPSQRRIRNRMRKFDNMLNRAKAYHVDANIESKESPLVEFAFHLGAIGKGKARKASTDNYPGINNKFFDDRQVEYLCLEQLQKSHSYKHVFTNMVSWSNCEDVEYRS